MMPAALTNSVCGPKSTTWDFPLTSTWMVLALFEMSSMRPSTVSARAVGTRASRAASRAERGVGRGIDMSGYLAGG